MIETIEINNFAIIDSIQIEFDRGLSALTGETGAGKSILLDAINLVAGDRADMQQVKSGSDKADISVCFNITNSIDAKNWLIEHDLDSDDDCIVRRTLSSNGRSRGYINGHNVTMVQLRTLCEQLLDIHGQHEHQSLQKPQVQLELLDNYHKNQALVNTVEDSFKAWKKLQKQIQDIQQSTQQREQRIDLLQLYCDELTSLNLKPGEYDKLQSDYKKLANAEDLLRTVSSVLEQLADNENLNVQQLISSCEQSLSSQLVSDNNLQSTCTLINQSSILIQEAIIELRHYQDSIDVDQKALDDLNQRIVNCQTLARKHHVECNDLPELTEKLNTELSDLVTHGNDLDVLIEQQSEAEKLLVESASQLSAIRQSTALELSKKITGVMQQLGMNDGSFSIQVTADQSLKSVKAHGIDTVTYMVSANPGVPLRPLTKVASGGELSRISLAIQVIMSESATIPTLIFDEVDSGVGGGIAEMVGNKLRLLGHQHQVLCVTHLPQVASQAHQHYKVSKTSQNGITGTQIEKLDDEMRLEEIARMLGGMTITEQSRAHADEMIRKYGT